MAEIGTVTVDKECSGKMTEDMVGQLFDNTDEIELGTHLGKS